MCRDLKPSADAHLATSKSSVAPTIRLSRFDCSPGRPHASSSAATNSMWCSRCRDHGAARYQPPETLRATMRDPLRRRRIPRGAATQTQIQRGPGHRIGQEIATQATAPVRLQRDRARLRVRHHHRNLHHRLPRSSVRHPRVRQRRERPPSSPKEVRRRPLRPLLLRKLKERLGTI